MIEAHQEEVILRTINPLQSAFVSISLSKTFFDGLRVKSAEGAKPISCQISLKVLLCALRSFLTVESIGLSITADRLTVELECKKGIKKIFELYVEEDSEMMTAIYDANSCPYEVAFSTRSMSEFVGDFSTNLDEVTFIPENNKLRVRCCKEARLGTSEPTTQFRTGSTALLSQAKTRFRNHCKPSLFSQLKISMNIQLVLKNLSLRLHCVT